MKDPFEFDPSRDMPTWELVLTCAPACIWALWVVYYLVTWEPPAGGFRG